MVASTNAGPSVANFQNNTGAYPRIITVSYSRVLTATDDGAILELTNPSLVLTYTPYLPVGFGCIVIPNGTTTVRAGLGVLLNGASADITRTATNNTWFGIQGRRSVANSALINGL
jgi:hypothetical protein